MPLPDWYARVGGHPALDLVNTLGWRGTDAEQDALGETGDLLAWGSEAGVLTAGEGDDVRARESGGTAGMTRAANVRSLLAGIFDALAHDERPSDADLEELKDAYARAVKSARLELGADGLVWSWAGVTGVDRVLHPIVVSMVELMGSDDARRVKVCGESTCGWMFLDRSKNASRRWCSMQICGSRTKMRRHYRNKKSETPP